MKTTRPHRFAKRIALRLIDVGNAKRWPKSLAALALLAIVRRVPPGAVRCRSLRSRHRPFPGLRRSLKFAKSLRQENASIFYDSGTSQTRRTISAIPDQAGPRGHGLKRKASRRRIIGYREDYNEEVINSNLDFFTF